MTQSDTKAIYHEDIDILYVLLQGRQVACTRSMGPWRNVDMAEDGSIIGIEFINAKSDGVDLRGVPEQAVIEKALQELQAYNLPIVV